MTGVQTCALPISNKISNKYLLSCDFWVDGDDPYNFRKKYEDLSIPHQEVIKEFHSIMSGNLFIQYFIDIKESNKKEIQQKIYEIVKYLESLKLGSYDIEIEFYDEAYFKDKDVVKIEKENFK